jgi:hypothetical protein
MLATVILGNGAGRQTGQLNFATHHVQHEKGRPEAPFLFLEIRLPTYSE